MITASLLKAIIAVISALSGAVFIFFIKLDHKKLCALISFSAGALMGAAVFVLIPEAAESLNFLEIILSALSGYLLFWFISKYFAHVCPACSASHFDERTVKKFSEIVLTLITALSIHSLLDGIALSTGGVGNGHDQSLFIAIATHKFPEGLALAALMFGSNYSKGKILRNVILVESSTIVGAVAGYYLFQSKLSPSFLGAVMGHIAGGFVYLSIHAVLGEMLKHHTKLVIISFVLGTLLIFSVHLLFSSI
jgi:zinc transporter ZupT